MRLGTLIWTMAAAGALLLASAPHPAAHDRHAGTPAVVATPPPVFDYNPPAAGSYRLSRIKPAADGVVLDPQGRRLALRPLLAGRLTVLSFIYTRCGDVCPMATVFLHDLRAEATASRTLAEAVQFISLSFDPEHDTPEVMASYASVMGAGNAADWHFLTTPGEEEIMPLLAGYGQAVLRKADPDDAFGPIAHQLQLYLIDRDGWVRNIYSLDYMDRRLVLADLETLLMEEAEGEDRG